MVLKRMIEIIGLTMIGEGVVGTLHPRRYLALWHGGPRPYRRIVETAIEHPRAMRAVFVATMIAGYCLATRQLESRSPRAWDDRSDDRRPRRSIRW